VIYTLHSLVLQAGIFGAIQLHGSLAVRILNYALCQLAYVVLALGHKIAQQVSCRNKCDSLGNVLRFHVVHPLDPLT